jgi:hypothetical protein
MSKMILSDTNGRTSVPAKDQTKQEEIKKITNENNIYRYTSRKKNLTCFSCSSICRSTPARSCSNAERYQKQTNTCNKAKTNK